MNWREKRGEISKNVEQSKKQSIILVTNTITIFDINKNKEKLILNGNTKLDNNNILILTENLPSQRGSGYYIDKIDISKGFICQFEFCITPTEINSQSADGFSFLCQSSGINALGEGNNYIIK